MHKQYENIYIQQKKTGVKTQNEFNSQEEKAI